MVDWEQVKVDAAINVLEAILENGTTGEILEIAPYIPVKQAVRVANYLVEELKRNSSNEDLSKEIEEDLKNFLHIGRKKSCERTVILPR